jgi:hypothetical protein
MAATGVMCALLTSCFDEESAPKEQAKPAKPAYILPAEVSVEVSAHRTDDGQITIVGTTNLPAGTRIDAELVSPSGKNQGQDQMFVRGDGSIHSSEFSDDGRPWPSGMHKVEISAYFNGAWQSPQILQIVGEGGSKLKGKLITHPEYFDKSDNVIDFTKALDFPPAS